MCLGGLEPSQRPPVAREKTSVFNEARALPRAPEQDEFGLSGDFDRPEVPTRIFMPNWDKAALVHDTQAFIEHLQRLEAQGCRWLVVPLTADESSASFKCSKCNSDTDLAALYSIATHVAFEEEVLRAIEASGSQAEYDDQVSRII